MSVPSQVMAAEVLDWTGVPWPVLHPIVFKRNETWISLPSQVSAARLLRWRLTGVVVTPMGKGK